LGDWIGHLRAHTVRIFGPAPPQIQVLHGNDTSKLSTGPIRDYPPQRLSVVSFSVVASYFLLLSVVFRCFL
jgi:hypothetical protein